jgi:hypothetical protein
MRAASELALALMACGDTNAGPLVPTPARLLPRKPRRSDDPRQRGRNHEREQSAAAGDPPPLLSPTEAAAAPSLL